MNKHIITGLILILTIIISLQDVYCQKYSSAKNKSIILIKDKNKKVNSVVFHDTVSKKEIKRLDIINNNPFREKYSFNKDHALNDYNDGTVGNTFKNFNSKYHTKDNKDFKLDRVSTNSQAAIDKSYLLALYELTGYHQNIPMGFQSIVQVYNQRGEKNGIDLELNHNVLDMGLSSNGKYIAIMYGFYSPEYGKIIDKGVSVYNIHNKKLLIEIKAPKVGFFFEKDLLVISEKYYENGVRMKLIKVYDLEKMIVHQRVFTYEEDVRIKGLNNDGYILKNANGETTILLFESEFNTEKL